MTKRKLTEIEQHHADVLADRTGFPRITEVEVTAADDFLAEVAADAEAAQPDPAAALASLSMLIEDYKAKTTDIAFFTDKTKALAATVETLVSQKIPDAMREAGVTKLNFDDGTLLTLRDIVAGNISKDKKEAAHEWLRANGHGGLIKTQVEIEIPRTINERGLPLVPMILGFCAPLDLAVDVGEGVHASTLKSWAKTMLEEGHVLPLELLGLFVGARAEIKLPKEK